MFYLSSLNHVYGLFNQPERLNGFIEAFYPDCFREELHIVEPKATCHITRQVSINARASVRYPIRSATRILLREGLENGKLM